MQVEHSAESDEAVARRVQDGDAEAFGILLDRYEARLSRYGRRFLARDDDIEDIVQDAFVSAFQNIRGFDSSQRFSPWMYRIAHNAFVNALKKRDRGPIFMLDFDTFVAHTVSDDSAEDERKRKETREMLEQVLVRIPAKYREILTLYYFEELPYADISDILSVPVGTVGVRLSRAREALKREYERMES